MKHIDEAMREVSARGVAVISTPDHDAADRLEAIARTAGAWGIGVRRSGPDEYTIWRRKRA